MKKKIDEIISQYIKKYKNFKEKDLTGLTLQNQQKEIFFYASSDVIYDDRIVRDFLYFDDEWDIVATGNGEAFRHLRIGDLVFARIVWFAWLCGVLLQGSSIYSHSKKNTSSKNGKKHGAYLKCIISDPLEVFKKFLNNKINYYGLENAGCDNEKLQINWKDANNYLKILDINSLPGYESKIQVFRFDPYGDEQKDKNTALFIFAKNRFIEHAKNVFGNFEYFDIIFEYYFNIGVNLIPIDNIYSFKYDEINSKTVPSKIVENFKSIDIDISNKSAKNINTFIKGAVFNNSLFSTTSAIGFRDIIIDDSHVPELNGKTVSFCLTPYIENKRFISNSIKKDVLRKYNYMCFVGNKKERGYKYIEDNILNDCIRYRACSTIFSENNCEWVINNNIDHLKYQYEHYDWNETFKDFGLTQKSTYHFHHNIFWNNLWTKGSIGLNCNECYLLSPLNEIDHIALHSKCKNEKEAAYFLIENGFLTKNETIDMWTNIFQKLKENECRLTNKKTTKLLQYIYSTVKEFIRE